MNRLRERLIRAEERLMITNDNEEIKLWFIGFDVNCPADDHGNDMDTCVCECIYIGKTTNKGGLIK